MHQPPSSPQTHALTSHEVARPLWHFGGVMLVLALYVYLSRPVAVQLGGLVASGIIAVDWGRMSYPPLNQLIVRLFKLFMRPHEHHQLSGATSMAVGLWILIYLFPREIVILTLILFATVDPSASYIGRRFGRDRLLGNKTLQGSLSGFAVGSALALIYFFITGHFSERRFLIALFCGLIAAIAELVPIGRLNDNLVFPLVSGSCFYFVYLLFGGFY